jgi:hypothetical protein
MEISAMGEPVVIEHTSSAAFGGRRLRRLGIALVAGVLGLVALVAGWIGTSGTRVISDQLAYIASGGMLGLFLVALACAVLLADYMAEQQQVHSELRERLTRIEQALQAQVVLRDGHGHVAVPAIDGQLVMIPGAERVHRPSCPLVQGKSAARAVEHRDLDDGRMKGCRTCSPDVTQLASN